MVQRLAARLGGLDEDLQIRPRLRLADEVGEALRPQRGSRASSSLRSGETMRSLTLRESPQPSRISCAGSGLFARARATRARDRLRAASPAA